MINNMNHNKTMDIKLFTINIVTIISAIVYPLILTSFYNMAFKYIGIIVLINTIISSFAALLFCKAIFLGNKEDSDLKWFSTSIVLISLVIALIF